MVKIEIYSVDGSYQSYEENDSILSELEELEQNGYSGKQLLDRLITDDWGVPPQGVVFTFNGNKKEISYK